MTMPSARRYAPSRTSDLQPQVLAVLDHNWCNVAAVCDKLRLISDDSAVRYCLTLLTKGGLVEQTSVRGPRGAVFLYRRRP